MKIALLIFIFIGSVFAQTTKYDYYFEEAGKYYNVPPLLLKKIAVIESSMNEKCVGINENKTVDYGLMQINSIHLKKLRPYGINEQNIMHPKINIFAAGWLLQQHIQAYGFNEEAIGRYHSATPVYKEKWLKKLITELKKEIKTQKFANNGVRQPN